MTRYSRRVWVSLAIVLVALISSCYVHREFEKRDVLKTHLRLMELLVAGKTEEAFQLTTSDYRAANSLSGFQAEFAHVKGDKLYLTKEARVLSCYAGSAEIFAWPHTGGMFDFLNGPSFYYRKENGEWRFTGEGSHYLD